MASAASHKRFMAPSGGPVAGPSSLPSQDLAMHSTNSFTRNGMSSNTRISRSYVHQRPQMQQPAPPSRYLVTVIPPEQLPHDPPHPRTSTFCSGYGPPSKFRRGTLVPLHPTLAGQMAAIAREYGLPSTGGIALYLVELSQDQPNSVSNALVGGPRIGDEAWQLLWGQLFSPPQDDCDNSLSEEEEAYFDECPIDQQNASVSDLPPLPPSMKPRQQQHGPQEFSALHRPSYVRPASPSDPQSDVSSLADNSSALASEDLLSHQSMVSSNTSHVLSPASLPMPHTKSSNSSHNQRQLDSIHNSPHIRPYSSASRGRPRNLARTQSRRPSTSVMRSNSSHHSNRSHVSYSQSFTSVEGPLFGEAVVVGKIEFDIDNRRGAGKWFDSWLQSASTDSSSSSSPLQAQSQARTGTGSLISRHQTSVSQSLLRDRYLISQPPQASTGPGSEESSVGSRPSSPNQPSHHVDELDVEDVTVPSPASRQTQSEARESVVSSDRRSISEMQPIAGSSEDTERQKPAQPMYTFSLDDAGTLAQATADPVDPVDNSKRSSSASQFSMLSPAQTIVSQRSSQEVAAWQTSLSQSFDGSLEPASERSSSSSFGHEANIEAMNATPRVRMSASFSKRGEFLSPSPARHTTSPAHSDGSLLGPPSDEQSPKEDGTKSRATEEPSQFQLPLEHSTSTKEVEPSIRPQSEISTVGESERASIASDLPKEGDVDTTEPAELTSHRLSSLSSDTPSHSRQSSSSLEDYACLDQHTYHTLPDDDGAENSPRSLLDLPNHQLAVQTNENPHDTGSEGASRSVATSDAGEDESRYAASEANDTTSVAEEDSGDADYLKSDPLKDVFPSDANTWAQIKYSQDFQDDSATDSPVEEVTQTALGLGISSTSMLHSRAIPPSASSSLDPFEFDDEARDTLNSPVGPPENDIKDVSELLKASTVPTHFGLSSPINLAESSKRLSKANQMASREEDNADRVVIDPKAPISRTTSAASISLSERSASPKSFTTMDAAMIALPISESNSSLSTMPSSTSTKSLASLSSQPSVSELDNTLTAPPKVNNRDARLPLDWADQLSALGNLRSRGNSDASHVTGREGEAGQLPGELPQFLSQLNQLPQSRASLASLYAQSARSRSSSVEMMDNLDEIERALAELSPRALKSSLRENAENGPNLVAFLRQSGALGFLPGYEKDSLLEQLASDTPRATPSEEDSVKLPPDFDLEHGHGDPVQPKETDDDYVPQEAAALAASVSSKSLDSHASGYMAPPLPLKIRTDRSAPNSPGSAPDGSGPTPLVEPTPLPQVGTPTASSQQAHDVTSPSGDSLASTAIPYDAPSIAGSPQQRVTFALDAQDAEEQPYTPTGKQGMSSKFAAGLKLKGWSGKHNQKDQAAPSSPLNTKETGSPEPSRETAKSPLPGLKGFKWWQKDASQSASDSAHKAATEVSLPASPSTPQLADTPVSILQKPNPPFSQTARIPRKSSLASLAATARSQESLSPNLQNVYSVPLPAASPAGTNSPHFTGCEFPSPPTHTSLPSPPRRPVRLPSFMPSYPPQFIVDDEERAEPTPPLVRNDSSTTQSTSAGVSPQLLANSGIASSVSLPVLGDSTSSATGEYYPQRTPEMGGNSSGVFLGLEGRTTSAPVTPASAIPSLVPSSGRYGKPSKANPAKAEFRLSADSDLSKMMKHMQAIEFGEEPEAAPEQGHEHPARKAPTRGNFGLGLGLPGIRKVTR